MFLLEFKLKIDHFRFDCSIATSKIWTGLIHTSNNQTAEDCGCGDDEDE